MNLLNSNPLSVDVSVPEHSGIVIVLANPTARNIEITAFLISHGIFSVNTESVRFLGVFHPGQTYDFSQSQAYIDQHNLTWISLREIPGKITTEDVFSHNDCTPAFREVFEQTSGILFFGGPDIQPELYGEENLYSDVTDPARHLFEVSLAFHLTGSSRNPEFVPFLAERPEYLVTGFCLGMQTMNVAAGGTLWQDIPAQLYNRMTPEETVITGRENLHRNYWQLFNQEEQLMGINLHSIRFTKHPFFGKTIGISKKSKPRIYSSHHQSPKDIGAGYEITALSPDGKVIEGLAHSRFPHVFGVQFHPEVPALYEDREWWKFEPGDKPRTMHRIIGKRSVRFHKKYWEHISFIIDRM
jgi:putative glutamine amidotransferase